MKMPVTAAVRALRAAKIEFSGHLYEYHPGGGAEDGARQLGFEDEAVVKTLVMQTEDGKPLVVLMHGHRKVSTRELARHLGVKKVEPCRPEVAERHSGYKVGGTSPFGLRKPMPIYAERSLKELPLMYVNGGKRGFLVGLRPSCLWRVLEPEEVEVASVK